ncbi:MAG: YciK family oxidoreductase [Steroidobacteraceae bacterium]
MTEFDWSAYRPGADELRGRVIAITGANGGIGTALALSCARHGAELVLLGRDGKALNSLADRIEDAGGVAPSIAVLDLENALAAQYDETAGAIQTRYGRLDGLVHMAALLGILAPVEHYDVPTWCRVLQVNLTAAFALTQVMLPLLRRSDDASVVFTTSSVGRKARAFWGAYAVSKFGVEALTQLLAEELGGSTRIRVNAVNPGRTRTRMRRQAYPSEDLGSLPAPEDVIAPYIGLLGPAARGINGRSFDCQRGAAAAPSAAAGAQQP